MFLDSPRYSLWRWCRPGCGVCSITQKSEIFSEIDAQRPLFYRSKISLNYIIRDFWLQISRKRFNFFENGAKVICSEFNSEPFGPIFEISKNIRKSRFWGKPHSQFCPPPATLLNTLHSRDDTSATVSRGESRNTTLILVCNSRWMFWFWPGHKWIYGVILTPGYDF